jgi:polyhydroxyalkanoate synthesis regulator phasin
MASVTLKKEEHKTFAVEKGCVPIQDSSNEEDILTTFNDLKAEENDLDEQKENLKSLLQQLEIKAQEQVEKQKRKVEKLNSEVSDLKRKCEKFSKFSKTVSSDSS